MLFNSSDFTLLFVSITLFVFFPIGRRSFYEVAILWLIAAFLFLYGWLNPAYLNPNPELAEAQYDIEEGGRDSHLF